MLKHYIIPVVLTALPATLLAQATFTNSPGLLNAATHSGGCMGVVDMNGDGLDDIAILDESENVVVEYQNPDGSFTRVAYGSVSNEGQWGWAIGDTDNDGHKEVFSGGSYDGVHHMKIIGPGAYVMAQPGNGSMFMQCANMADMNNDGWLDAFGCHDDAAPRQWYNDMAGDLVNFTGIDYSTNPASDMSGNYGSVFTDFDNDGDIDYYISHCRQGVNDANDPRRWNRLFVNDGNNNYTDQTAAYGLFNNNQSWTSDFGDYDNDGDFDVVTTNHNTTMQLFENDGTGHYTEVTAGSGLEITGFFLQSLFRDFDNDGFLDLLIAGGLERYFKGNGDGTFTEYTNQMPSNNTLHSFATGDLNNDGFIDVFAGYGTGYIDPTNENDRLWLNDGNANHWFGVHLQGTVSNRDAVGARTWLYGPWGVQTREVRAGESYGLVNSFAAHFGLGSDTQIDSLVIDWPAGGHDVYTNLTADGYVTAVEGACISPVAVISGPTVVCPGQPITLSASAGNGYTWSTGETTPTIQVNAAGFYSVTVDNGNGCPSWTSLMVLENPDETPEVSLSGAVEFCEGGSVTLTSEQAPSYTWSNGDTGQSTVVTLSGTYTVSVPSSCGTSTSAAVVVNVVDVPPAPTSNDVLLPAPGTATLNATGANVSWFDAAVGGTIVGTGNSWTTPFLGSSTTYWCADINGNGDPAAFGGKTSNDAVNGQFHNNGSNYLRFDAAQDFILVSVKVYANGAGNRQIEAVDDNGNTIANGTFAVPDGESRVELNFSIPAGTGHSLRCTSNNPQLWRDGLNSNPAYPFQLGTFGSITESSAGGANALEFYYFFYDWEVADDAVSCASPRTEVLVDVASGIGEVAGDRTIAVWPNPANDNMSVSFPAGAGQVRITLTDLSGRAVLRTELDAKAVAAGVVTLDLNGLAAGPYNLALSGSVNAVQRVVVR